MLMLATSCLFATAIGQAQERPQAVVTVFPDEPIANIDPRFFGFFSEHIFDALDWKLAAQKIKGRGFENGDSNGDGVADPWQPLGEASYSLDTSTSFPRFESGESSTSQRIDVRGAGGLSQGFLSVNSNDPLELTLYLRAEPGIDEFQVSIAGAEATLTDLPAEWEERSVTLTASQDVFPAELRLEFRGEGTVWVDQVSMIAESSVHGWREDIVDLYEWMRPATLRYPGGNFCQTYHWPVGIGDPDLRPVVPNPAWNDYPEPNNIGTDEFLRLCETVGMEPIICLNIGDTGGERTLPNNSTDRAFRESLDWLEYVNGDPATEWGRRRAENGHPEPYGVKLWEVGNEIGYGHIHGRLTAEQYVPKFRRFAEALLDRDPSLELIACGHDAAWNRLLVEEAGDLADFVAIHIYDNVAAPGDAAAHPYRVVSGWLDEHIQALKDGGATPETTRLALNEWSYSWSHWTGAERAVAATGLLHECLKRADWVAMTNTSDTVARFRLNEAMAVPDPECLAIALLNHNTGQQVLRTQVESVGTDTASRGVVPAVDAVSTRDDDVLHLSLVNRGFSPVDTVVELPVTGAELVSAQAIRAEELGAQVSFGDPGAVAIVPIDPPAMTSGPGGVSLELTLAPMSVASLRLRVAGDVEQPGASDRTAPSPAVELASMDDGAILPWEEWTPTSIQGPEGSAEIEDGLARVTSAGDSRFGMMSPVLDLGEDDALVVEARLESFTGINALMHLCAEGSEEDMGRMVEVGVEHGRAQVWAGPYSWTGEPVPVPTAVRVVIGPAGPGGRVVETFVDGQPCQRIPGVRWLDEASPRVFLYGWGEGERRWHAPRMRRVTVNRRVVFEDAFTGDSLDADRWTATAVVGNAGTVDVHGGAVHIEGAAESRFGVLTDPLPQDDNETLIVTAELLDYDGPNGLMTLLGGRVGDFTDYAEAGVENGHAQAWIREWSKAGAEVDCPATVTLVAGPPDAEGQRRISAYVNGELVSYAPHVYSMERPLRLFLYGWGASRTVWGSVRVESVDSSALVGEMLAPGAGAG